MGLRPLEPCYNGRMESEESEPSPIIVRFKNPGGNVAELQNLRPLILPVEVLEQEWRE